MVYTTLDDYNTSAGIHTLFLYTADVVPIFIPLILFAIFTITCLGSYFAQIRLKGSGDFPASFAVAGILVTIIAQLFAIIPNIINIGTLAICYGVGILGVLFLYFSRDNVTA